MARKNDLKKSTEPADWLENTGRETQRGSTESGHSKVTFDLNIRKSYLLARARSS